MKTIQVKLCDSGSLDEKWSTLPAIASCGVGTSSSKWTPFLRARFDTTVLVAKTWTGYEYPIRNVIKQIDSRTIEIISEKYTVAMLQRLARLQKDFTFPAYQVKLKEREGWKH
jgi:hypothetical protein